MPSSSDPTEPLRAHFRKEREHIDQQHPSPEQIVAYHERRLPPDEAERVRAHLAICSDCTAELLELAALLEADDAPDSDMSRQDLDAAWQRQRAQLIPASPVVSLETRRTRGPSPRWAWTTAASLGLAAALLAVMVVDQRRTIERLAQPQANPPLVNLAPVDSVRRGGQEAPELRILEDAERAWVILNPVAELDSPTYDVEIVAPGGETVLRLQDLRSSEAGSFRLEIPRSVVKAGPHRVLLIGGRGEERQVVEEFAFRVVMSPQSSP